MESFRTYHINGGRDQNPTALVSSKGEGIHATVQLISEAIDEHISLKQLSTLKSYHITDLGCSVGPNTFAVVQNVIGAVEHKLLSLGVPSNVIDFQVSFNDHESNDFNTLFSALPANGRRYFAAGAPGSFHGRLFPKASLHFVHSSYAIHWMSQVPDEVRDEKSHAWNKGRILSIAAKKEVAEAYAAQFAKDIEVFLKSRAEEVAADGLMALTFPFSKGFTYVEQSLFYRLFRILELTLNDMAAGGRLDAMKVNSFNLPIYIPPAEEIQKLIERNGSFTIENMQPLTSATKGFSSRLDARKCSMIVRAPMEGIMTNYFGAEAIDKVFERYVEIAQENSEFISQSAALTEDLFVLLKRKG
ncbi:loganic acid O-methyltransferase-like [Aristolochia californica]|uniref:loganic acid O-methyltransferase-like n=1 Tax=Aristolochia californica TaxID=171875 RepID=UPI0035DCC88B